MTRRISASFSIPASYDVIFTRSLFDTDNSVLADLLSKDSDDPAITMWALDEGMLNQHPNIKKSIVAYSKKHADKIAAVSESSILTLPGGETTKNNPDHVDKVLRSINELNLDRHAYVLSIGGGALIDTVGFCASIAHRGIRHIRIPTTVLAQNDAGIGVKNGTNLYSKKNFIGTFEIPYGIINDSDFIKTLSDRDVRSGIAEAVKVALIRDAGFFAWIEDNADALNARNSSAIDEMIHRCADLHIQHICEGGDPFEKGSARPLDYGHWSAHKIESMSDYKIRHGEAVAIGMAADSCYAESIGWLPNDECDRIISLLKKLGFQLAPEVLDRSDELLKGLDEFREHLGGKLTIILLKGIGNAEAANTIDRDVVAEIFKNLRQTFTSVTA